MLSRDASDVGFSVNGSIPAFSQIVELNASENFHSMGRVRIIAMPQNVEMDNRKNGGPNFLEAWRKRRKMTLEELATQIGTSPSVIGYLESGERGLSAKWLRRLAKIWDFVG